MLIENPLNGSELAFPILECIHIVGFSLSVGTIAMVDLRMLGVGAKYSTAAQLYKDTFLWTLVGLIIMIFSGLLLFSSDPEMYYLNWAFVIKIACLIIGIAFNYTLRRKAVLSGGSGGTSAVIAAISLGLWGAVVFGGIFIAFIDQGL